MHLDGLMEHQAAGVPWLLDNPRGMLAWEMGVGKTATAARAWELTADQGPLLVLCLASARENWRREIQRFAIDPDFPPTVQILFNKNTPIDPAASVVVTNYDKLQQPQLSNACLRRRWGAIMCLTKRTC
jgi:SNF2 family DNA or RNA helicase